MSPTEVQCSLSFIEDTRETLNVCLNGVLLRTNLCIHVILARGPLSEIINKFVHPFLDILGVIEGMKVVVKNTLILLHYNTIKAKSRMR